MGRIDTVYQLLRVILVLVFVLACSRTEEQLPKVIALFLIVLYLIIQSYSWLVS